MTNRDKRRKQKRIKREKRVRKQVANYRRSRPLDLALGLPKMSEALLEIAAPLLEGLRTAAEAAPMMNFAVAIWNLTVIADFAPSEECDDLIEEILDEMAPEDGAARDECADILEMVMERKRLLFGHDRRICVAVQVIDTPQGIHVRAISEL